MTINQSPFSPIFTIPLLITLAICFFCFILLQSRAEAAGHIQNRASVSSKQKPAKKTAGKRKPTGLNRKASQKSAYTKSALPGIDSDNIATYAAVHNSSNRGIPFQFASAGSIARNLPKGLQVANKGVQTQCFKPKLLSLLGTIQHRFNRPVIITSGYRSLAHNSRVNGAKHSLHISCAAADIKVVGIHKSEVAKFVRSLPDRGGVGTYCGQSIHVDIGSRRDWNWGCGKKR